jgi:3'-phosphoadenosine 5'-phosphosulfate sulfotransferase (PAPS reductase)/FAD synthetase
MVSIYISDILNKFREDVFNSDKNIVIRYSGGKDSTLLVLLVFQLVKSGLNPDRFTVINSDTLMELPTIYSVIQIMQSECMKRNINFVTVAANPDRGFFYEIFARGIVVSNQHVRRCTDKLKIEPYQSEYKKSDHITVTGVHFGESTARDSRLKKSSCNVSGNDCGSISSKKEDEPNLLKPILNLRNCQVWDAIQELEYGLNISIFEPLKESYTLIDGEIKAGDSSLRTGCIGCPVISLNTHAKSQAMPDNYSLRLAMIWERMKDDNLRLISPKSIEKDGSYKYKTSKKGDNYLLHGAYPFEVRKYFWAIVKPLLLEIREKTGVKMLENSEIELIEESLSSGTLYPRGYTPELISKLLKEWEPRKPRWLQKVNQETTKIQLSLDLGSFG